MKQQHQHENQLAAVRLQRVWLRMYMHSAPIRVRDTNMQHEIQINHYGTQTLVVFRLPLPASQPVRPPVRPPARPSTPNHLFRA